jgi:hypothetical protein
MTGSRRLPNRMVLHAKQKWGKTSFAACSPSPIFLMTRGEDGLETLIASGQLPDVPHFQDQAQDWNDVLLALDDLIVKDHPHKTFVLDTLNGALRLRDEHVCRRDYDNDWHKFDHYAKGTRIEGVKEASELTQRLDRLREKGMAVILLCHSQVKTFKNPEGSDYDRWEPVMDKDTWAHFDRWADLILFGNFETFTDKIDPKKADTQTKAKARGGEARILMTERTAAYDAGNRHGLPREIECGNSPQEAWAAILAALPQK